jgi:diaminopimelate decarboxylase
MTERIQEFLRNRRNEGQDVEPCLVVDLEVVRDNYQTFSKALPDSRVFYASRPTRRRKCCRCWPRWARASTAPRCRRSRWR